MFWNPPRIVNCSESKKHDELVHVNIKCEKQHLDVSKDLFGQFDYLSHVLKSMVCDKSRGSLFEKVINDIHNCRTYVHKFIDSIVSTKFVISDYQAHIETIVRKIQIINENIDVLLAQQEEYSSRQAEEEEEESSHIVPEGEPVSAYAELMNSNAMEKDESEEESEPPLDTDSSTQLRQDDYDDPEEEFLKTYREYEGEAPLSEHEEGENEEHDDSMHVIIHELISALGQLGFVGNHDLLDDVIQKLPEIPSCHYPTKDECPDALERQSQILCMMSKIYSGVSRLSMEQHKSPSLVYEDKGLLSSIMTCPKDDPFGFLLKSNE